jgi:zinc transport system ATP-binding protein
VEVSGVTFKYGQDTILEKVSLNVAPGEFLALIGPNGGGKTTLLHLILGLLQPDSGAIRVFGNPPGSMNRRIGYVPQFSTAWLDFPASVLEMVLMGAATPSLNGGRWRIDKNATKQAMEYLDVLGIADCARLQISALSGGQRQRAMVARALMSHPDIVRASPSPSGEIPFLMLLDEPTASIDPQGTFCFYEFLGKLRGHISLLVVSHDLFMVSPFFNSIAVVNKGLIRLQSTELTPDNLTALFGRHLHDCPVADLQHAGKVLHQTGCTHPSCAEKNTAPASKTRYPSSFLKQDR